MEKHNPAHPFPPQSAPGSQYVPVPDSTESITKVFLYEFNHGKRWYNKTHFSLFNFVEKTAKITSVSVRKLPLVSEEG